jgi:hypothetical protein
MSQNIGDMSAVWGTATQFTGIKYNVTGTDSSLSTSLLMDLQVGGVSQLSVSKTGQITKSTGNLNLQPTGGVTTFRGNEVAIDGGWSFVGLRMSDRSQISWSSGGTFSGPELTILRDAANTLAQRNGANAQEFRLYGTYTAADNFQRLAITSASVTLSALSGASVTATGLIPAGAVVMGVTSRVSTLITGADGYQIGTGADADRWADKTGVAVGTTTDNRDWTAGTIENFAAATDVIVTAKTANFTAGAIVVTVHYLAGQAD